MKMVVSTPIQLLASSRAAHLRLFRRLLNIIVVSALTVTAPFMKVLGDVPLAQKQALLTARRSWELLYPLKCPDHSYALPLVMDLQCDLAWPTNMGSCWTTATDPCSGKW